MFDRDSHKMRADSEQAWLCFQNPRYLQQPFTVLRFVPPFIEVWYEPGWPLYRETRLS